MVHFRDVQWTSDKNAEVILDVRLLLLFQSGKRKRPGIQHRVMVAFKEIASEAVSCKSSTPSASTPKATASTKASAAPPVARTSGPAEISLSKSLPDPLTPFLHLIFCGLQSHRAVQR